MIAENAARTRAGSPVRGCRAVAAGRTPRSQPVRHARVPALRALSPAQRRRRRRNARARGFERRPSDANGRFGDVGRGALGLWRSAGASAGWRVLAARRVVLMGGRDSLGRGRLLGGPTARAGAGPGLGELGQGPVGVVVQPAQAGAQEGVHLLAAGGEVGLGVGVLAGLRPEGPRRMRVLAGHDQDHLIMACHLSTARLA